jgi:hypothetical protein
MFAKRDLILSQEYLGFLLLSIADLFLTGWIFRHQGMEANVVALWVLRTFKYAGFAIFKFLMVIVIILICETISTHDLAKARAIILGGSAIYLVVVIYECVLIYQNIAIPELQGQVSSIIQHLPMHGLFG